MWTTNSYVEVLTPSMTALGDRACKCEVIKRSQGFPGLVVKTLCSQFREPRFSPWSGSQDSTLNLAVNSNNNKLNQIIWVGSQPDWHLKRKRCQSSLCPSASHREIVWGHKGKAAVYKPGREASQKLNVFGTLILDLDSAELWENEFLLCEAPAGNVFSWQYEDWCLVPSSLRSSHLPHSVFGVHVPGTVQGFFS